MVTDLWKTPQGVIDLSLGASKGTLAVGLMPVLIRRLPMVPPYMDEDVQEAIVQYISIQDWSMVNNDSNDPNRPLFHGPNKTGLYADVT